MPKEMYWRCDRCKKLVDYQNPKLKIDPVKWTVSVSRSGTSMVHQDGEFWLCDECKKVVVQAIEQPGEEVTRNGR